MFRYLFLLLLSASLAGKVTGQDRPNILFIAVDDLRPELGCYGNELMVTPNLDRLASRGVVFREHFVTVPTCGASRYSLLTGRLPRVQQELSRSEERRVGEEGRYRWWP